MVGLLSLDGFTLYVFYHVSTYSRCGLCFTWLKTHFPLGTVKLKLKLKLLSVTYLLQLMTLDNVVYQLTKISLINPNLILLKMSLLVNQGLKNNHQLNKLYRKKAVSVYM